MRKNAGAITAIFLLFLFLLPMVVKVEHHHEHFVCHAKHEKHLHLFRDHCPVCSFEFSVFSFPDTVQVSEKATYTDSYNRRYRSAELVSFPDYSFHLRAPPYENT